MFKKVFYNTFAQIVGKVFTAGSTLIVTLLIGRSLGPAGYGEFTKIFVFVGYFYTFVDFGLNTIYVREAEKEDQIKLLKILTAIRLVSALFFVLGAIFLSRLLPYDPILKTGFSPTVKLGIVIASLTILTQALFTTANAFFQKNLRYDLSTLAVVSGSVVILISAIVATVIGASVLGYTVIYVLGGLAMVTTASIIIIRRSKQIICPSFDLPRVARLVASAWPVGLALIFNLIYFRNDIYILGITRTSSEVGIYGLAYQFFENSLTIPIFFANAIYPLLLKTFGEDKSQFYKQVKFWIKTLLVFSVALAVFLQILSYLIPVYDVRFADSQKALQILSFGLPFFFVSALLWHLLIIFEKQRHLVVIYGLGAILNFLLNLTFIPKFGYQAAATTTVFSEGIILMMLIVFLVKITNQKIVS